MQELEKAVKALMKYDTNAAGVKKVTSPRNRAVAPAAVTSPTQTELHEKRKTR